MKIATLKKLGIEKSTSSFRGRIFQIVKEASEKNGEAISSTMIIKDNEDMELKKVTSSLSNLFRDNKIQRLYSKQGEAFYFVE